MLEQITKPWTLCLVSVLRYEIVFFQTFFAKNYEADFLWIFFDEHVA